MGIWSRASGILTPSEVGNSLSMAGNVIVDEKNFDYAEVDALGTDLASAAPITNVITCVRNLDATHQGVRLPINPTLGKFYYIANPSDVWTGQLYPGQLSDTFGMDGWTPGMPCEIDYLITLIVVAVTNTEWRVVQWE